MDFKKPLSLGEVAEIINGKVIGDSNAVVTGLNELHVVRSGDISFVDHPKYYNKVLGSAATFIIINKEVAAPDGKSLIFHDAPMDAFNKLIDYFRPMVPSVSILRSSA